MGNLKNKFGFFLVLFLLAAAILTYSLNKKSTYSPTNAEFLSSTTAAFEAENGNVSGPVSVITGDSSTSNNSYIQFTQQISEFQPSAPYYATFYYPWYKTQTVDGSWSYWQDNGHSPPNNWFANYLPDYDPAQFNPTVELYSSLDDRVIYWQLRKLAEAKQEVAISSWWNPQHKTDIAFSHIISDLMQRSDNPYPNFRWALYYEKEGDNSHGLVNDPQVSELVSDLNYIADNYANKSAFFKINNRPVIFVYADVNDCGTTNPCDSTNTNSMLYRWSQAKQQARGNFYIVLKVFSGFANAPFQPDSWHQYAPANRSGQHSPFSSYVSPGFWKNGDTPRLTRDLSAFETAVNSMVSANTTFKLIETWNEWGEGSSVEPGDQVTQLTSGISSLDPNGVAFKNAYIDVLNNLLPPLERGTGVR